MGWFNLQRFRKKKARPVGKNLEKGREEAEQRAARQNSLIKASIFLALVLLTLAAFPSRDIYQTTVTVGREWQQETLTAPFDFPIFRSAEDIQADRQQIRYQVKPIFHLVPDAVERMRERRQIAEEQLQAILDAYTSYRMNQSRGRLDEALEDSSRYMELRRNTRVLLTPAQWTYLTESYLDYVPELASSREVPSATPPVQAILDVVWDQATLLVDRGVLDLTQDSIYTESVVIRMVDANQDLERDTSNVLGLDEARSAAQATFADTFEEEEAALEVASAFFRAIFVPNYTYLEELTNERRRQQASRIPTLRGKVSQGEIIVRNGQVVTDEMFRKLRSLERHLESERGTPITWRRAFGQFMLAVATYFIFFLYLFLLRRQIFSDNRKVLLIALLFALVIGLFASALRLFDDPVMYAVPVAIASVLLTVMFDSRVGLFGTLTLAFIGGQLLNYDFEFAFATMFAGTLGVFSVRDIKNRSQFFLSAGFILFGYALVLVASWLFHESDAQAFLYDLMLVGVNALLVLMAYPLMWIFERSFDITTDLTLLELSNTNRPLLKELSLRAPGSFNHSLQVANLAEAAADSVGANALLARVGALYHDIGKMMKPEYFVENQRPGENPHDQLKPRMSALIIASHVKEGLEIGRQNKLPQRVLDFIPTHHGTSRIEYFYRKAQEQLSEEEVRVHEAEFRYPGPRPNSKETGILMLADSVEAASRSLSEPNHKRLESLIDGLFKARIEDGQLADTDITFQELSRIKESFLSVLMGIYHVRVKYPDQPKEDDDDEPAGPPAVASDAGEGEASPPQPLEEAALSERELEDADQAKMLMKAPAAPSTEAAASDNGAAASNDDVRADGDNVGADAEGGSGEPSVPSASESVSPQKR